AGAQVGELADRTVAEVVAEDVRLAREVERASIARERRRSLAGARGRELAHRQIATVDQVQVTAGGDGAPALVGRDVAAGENRRERVGRGVGELDGLAAVRRHAPECRLLVPRAAARLPAEVDRAP